MHIVIIGAGIIGLSLARELSLRGQKDITIIEKESKIAYHQSSRNSGVMHAGLYYKPGSLKANLCREGIKLMKAYCMDNNISWEECGKVVISKNKNECKTLDKLLHNGKLNKLIGIEKKDKKEIQNIEPYVECSSGIFVPEESIVSFRQIANSFLNEIQSYGVKLKLKSELMTISDSKQKNNKKILLKNGEVLEADMIISAAGVYSDKIANKLGIDINNQKIIPFRGEYFQLKNEFKYLVKGLIYPVPNPNFPFLGVHFTKMINGEVEAGPNAVLALAREGYNWRTIKFDEFTDSITYKGLVNFIRKYPATTISEISRSLYKSLFVRSLRELIPDINENMIEKKESGIRAQLMNTKGDLIQDFDIRIKGRLVSILNAPSPAATSSIAIARYIISFLDV